MQYTLELLIFALVEIDNILLGTALQLILLETLII